LSYRNARDHIDFTSAEWWKVWTKRSRWITQSTFRNCLLRVADDSRMANEQAALTESTVNDSLREEVG